MTIVEPATHDDIERLLADPSAIVLVARAGKSVVGLVVGYVSESSPTRLPVTYGVLRSMYVDVGHRDAGVGGLLAETFISWARAQGCAEVHVDAYIANQGAQRFYGRHGFDPRAYRGCSVSNRASVRSPFRR